MVITQKSSSYKLVEHFQGKFVCVITVMFLARKYQQRKECLSENNRGNRQTSLELKSFNTVYQLFCLFLDEVYRNRASQMSRIEREIK